MGQEALWPRPFFFQDDASFLVREQLEGFLDELEKCGEKLYWYYETREDIFLSFRDLWKRMKRNGLFKIVFGLESPDPKQRQRFGKQGYDRSSVHSMMLTLALGDSVYALNPVYGQGMTVAALEALTLDASLSEHRRRHDVHNRTGLARDFQKQLAKVNAGPWQLATGQDLRWASTRPPATRPIRSPGWCSVTSTKSSWP